MYEPGPAELSSPTAEAAASRCSPGILFDELASGLARIGAAAAVAEVLPEVLSRLAGLLRFDRAYVLESGAPLAGIAPAVVFQWSGALRAIPLPSGQLPPPAAVCSLPDWALPLARGTPALLRRTRVAAALQQYMLARGAASSVIVPLRVDGQPWGLVGFEACGGDPEWSELEVRSLNMLAQIIGTAITRERHLTDLARAETIVQNSPTVLYRLRGEPQLPMIYVSRNVERIGYRQSELLAAPTLYRELIHPDDRERVTAALTQLLQRDAPGGRLEFRMLTREGEVRWFDGCYTPVRDEAQCLREIEGILIDISERKRAEASFAQLARTDPLTGLANRMTFSEQLRQSFAGAQRGARAFAVLYLDLDRFKEINDTLGHHAGDRLLQEVARRLRAVTREIDLVARLGGDEFAIVQAGIEDSSGAGTLAEKLIDIVSAPYVIDGNELRVGVSIGISLYDAHAGSPDALLMQADQALYRAKHAGRGRYRFHSDEIDHEVRAQMALAEDLRGALARQELEMRYQPQVELTSGRIVGMEALLRWNHPVRGPLLPEDFLPIAEKYGLMQQLGRWSVDAACRQMAAWRAAAVDVPVVAINVSLAQIKMGMEFVRDVTASIARWGLRPADIELDVTELVLARSTLAQSSVLDQLRCAGVGIAIDNFGSQYSTLDYLRSYRVSRLKIARGMIAAADAEPGGAVMIRAILNLARELGIDVVVEGIEAEMQRRLLLQAGGQTHGQRFLYGGAVPAEDALRMLRVGIVESSGDSCGTRTLPGPDACLSRQAATS